DPDPIERPLLPGYEIADEDDPVQTAFAQGAQDLVAVGDLLVGWARHGAGNCSADTCAGGRNRDVTICSTVKYNFLRNAPRRRLDGRRRLPQSKSRLPSTIFGARRKGPHPGQERGPCWPATRERAPADAVAGEAYPSMKYVRQMWSSACGVSCG